MAAIAGISSVVAMHRPEVAQVRQQETSQTKATEEQREGAAEKATESEAGEGKGIDVKA